MNRILWAGIGLSTLLFAACADDPTHPSGGGSIQPGEKISGLYVANADNSITRIDLDTGVMKQIELGQEPTRIARNGSRVYVSLRNERAVIVLEENGTDLEQVARIETGAEPFGVAATDSRLYVAASVGGTVDEFDTSSFEQLRSWKIPGEPRWIVLHPSHKSLFAGSTYGGAVTRIDLGSGVASRVAIPRIDSFNFRDGSPVTLAARVTGDLAVAPDGKSLYIPMLFVDNQSTIPNVDDIDPNDPCNGVGGPRGAGDAAPGVAVPPGGMGGCGGGGYDNQKFNPVATKVPLVETDGTVDVNLVPEAIQLVTGVAVQDKATGQVIGFENLNSYPSAVAVSGDSTMVFATLEGSAALIAFSADLPGGPVGVPVAEAGAPRTPNSDVAFPPGGFSFRSIVPVRTGAAPRGVAVVGDKVYVHAFFDRQVQEIAMDDIQKFVDFQSNGFFDKGADILNNDGSLKTLTAANPRTVSANTIDPDVDAGRRLFYAANNPLMSSVGAGVSCVTCHFDNRTDGLVWHFDRGPRATPNLSTHIEDTLPVGWAGNVPTAADEGFNTSQKLMGGTGLSTTDASHIQKFLYGLREIDSPNKGVSNDAVVRGAAVFANVGCNSCHSGASYTDGKVYSMLGLDVVNPPSLKGIAATAPFFHDGTSESLESVIERAANGEMGARFNISAAEKADLVEYLKSL